MVYNMKREFEPHIISDEEYAKVYQTRYIDSEEVIFYTDDGFFSGIIVIPKGELIVKDGDVLEVVDYSTRVLH